MDSNGIGCLSHYEQLASHDVSEVSLFYSYPHLILTMSKPVYAKLVSQKDVV